VLVTQRSPAPGAGGADTERALAVMPFENLKQPDDPDRLGQILQELIITDLSDVDELGLFSSQRLYDVHKQIAGTSERVIDPSRITEVATRAGATTLLTGSLSQLGSRWILTGQLVDVSSGKVLQSERIDGEDLYRMVDELSGKIRADLVDAAAAATDRAIGERTTDSLEAYQLYIEGKELMARREFREADDKFLAALELDPAFGQAQFLLAESRGWGFLSGLESRQELLEILLEDGRFKLPEKERLLARTGLAFQKKEWPKAERLARQATARYPEEKDAWKELADVLYHKPASDYDEVMRLFEKALELDPTYEPAYQHIADIYRVRGEWDKLAAKVEKLAQSEPANPAWYIEWISALLDLGDAAGAEEVLEDALTHVEAPEDRQRLLARLAREFWAAAQWDRARELVSQAAAVPTDATQVDVLDMQLWIASQENDYDEEERLARRILELRPRHFGAYFELQGLLFDQQRSSDAILTFRALIAKTPDHQIFYEGWMRVALTLGDEDEARRAFDALLSKARGDSARASAWMGRANAYSWLGDAVKGLEYAEKAAKLDESRRGTVGRMLVQLDRLEEAEAVVREIARDASDIEHGSKQQLFNILRDRGKTEEALRHAERWREVRPADDFAHVSVIESHLMAGREAEAERALQAGLDFPRRPDARARFLIWASRPHGSAGRHDKAEELVRQALTLGRSADAAWLWGFLLSPLMAQEKYGEVEETLDRMKDLRGGLLTPREQRNQVYLALDRGDSDAAVRMALEQLSRDAGRRNLISAAEALAAAGRFAEAEPHARKAFAMNPERDAHRLLAWILIAGDIDIDEGIALAERARSLPAHWSEPNWLKISRWNPSIPHALGLAHLKQGRPEEAIPLLEEAARLQPRRTLVQEHLRQSRQ